MTSTRAAKKTTTQPTPAKKTAARKTTTGASRPTRKRPALKTAAGAPKLSLVKPRKPLPVRDNDWMTDIQGYATCAALIVGIRTENIRDWRDHRDGTATRRLRDGSHLHYNLASRTLTWQAVCRMGATHQYELASPSMACAARLHAGGCTTLHADLTKVPALTADELEALGLLQTPTWAQKVPGDEPITETIPVPLTAPAPEPRALGDELTHSTAGVADTQPLSRDEIAEGLAARADTETPKEHPQP